MDEARAADTPSYLVNDPQNGNRPWSGFTPGGAKAIGRNNQRFKGITRVQSELATRGLDLQQAYELAAQSRQQRAADRSAELGDDPFIRDENGKILFEKGPKYGGEQPGMFGDEPTPEPPQESLFTPKAGTEASRPLPQAEVAARQELAKLRVLARTASPIHRALYAGRIADLEKLVNRGGAIAPGEMATRAAADAPAKVDEHGQSTLFEKAPDAFSKAVANPTGPEAQASNQNESRSAFGNDRIKEMTLGPVRDMMAKIEATKMPTAKARAASIAPHAKAPSDVSFIGTKVSSLDDLYRIGAIARHPGIEHFHIVLLRQEGDGGVVVGHQLETSGAISFVDLSIMQPGGFDALNAKMEAAGATHYALIHNHPSGDIRPSPDADVPVTQRIDAEMRKRGKEMLGHVITDHNKASWMRGDGSHGVFAIPEGADPAANWEVDGDPVQPPTLAAMGRSLVTKDGFAMVALDSQNRVVAVEPRPAPDAARLNDWMGDRLRALAAAKVVLLVPRGMGDVAVGQWQAMVDAHSMKAAGLANRDDVHLASAVPPYHILDIIEVTPHPTDATQPPYVQSFADNGWLPYADHLILVPSEPTRRIREASDGRQDVGAPGAEAGITGGVRSVSTVRHPVDRAREERSRRSELAQPAELALDDAGRNGGSNEQRAVVAPAGLVAEGAPEYSTGIKNAVSQQTRKQLGLDALDEPDTRSFDEMYDAGKKLAADDPGALQRLTKELADNPEKILATDGEAGLALHYKVTLENDLRALVGQQDAAKGNPEAERLVQAQLDAKREEIDAFTAALKRTGTAGARAMSFRRAMSAMDYSLSHMEATAAAAKGAKLTVGELAEIRAAHEQLHQHLAAVEQDKVQAEERARNLEADLHHAELLADAMKPRMQRLALVLDKSASAAEARLKARGFRAMSGLDPQDLADLAVVGAREIGRGATRFADWSAAMTQRFGSGIAAHLDEIHQAATDRLVAVDKAHQPKEPKEPAKPAPPASKGPKNVPSDLRSRMLARLDDGADLGDLQPYLRKLALEHINDGITTREGVLSELHREVQAAGVDATREEVRDALSGYGQFKPLDKAADKTTLRDIQAQSQKLAQLDALRKGESPLASGFERGAPSDETRALTKQVNDAKKAAGILPMDEEGRLKSALASAKTRVRNQIADLQTEIDTGTRIVAGKHAPISDPELAALKAQLADLRKTEAEVFGNAEMSDEQRLKLAIKAAERNAKSWTDRLAAARRGEFATADRPKRHLSPEMEALKAKAALARTEYEELKGLDPAQNQLKSTAQNNAYRTRLAAREAELRDRMAREDYSPKPPRPGMVLDTQSRQRQADLEAVRQEYQGKLRAFEKARRGPVEKARDRWLAFRNLSVLSSPATLAKLTSAAAARMVTTPVVDAVAGVVGRALPRLSAGAERYAPVPMNVALHAETEAQVKMWTDGIKDAGKNLRNQRGTLDLMHGGDQAPPALHEYFRMVHSALQSPTKWAEYTRSLTRRTYTAAARGEDTSDPAVKLRLSTEAYQDALREVFLDKNVVAEAWRAQLHRLELKDKRTGKAHAGAKVLATIARTVVPIVNVPLNVVSELSEFIGGLPLGSFRAAWAYYGGIDDLKPVERDGILRQISKGALGAAAMSLGYYWWTHRKDGAIEPGGQYQPGEKRPKGAVPAGALRVGEKTVPAMLLHSPFFQAAQYGATVAQVAGSKLARGDADPQGFGSALLAASLGVTSEVPFVETAGVLGKLVDPHERPGELEKLATDLTSVGAVRWVAQQTDRNDDGPVTRYPATKPLGTGIAQHIEANIPGLRQTLPTVPPRNFGPRPPQPHVPHPPGAR